MMKNEDKLNICFSKNSCTTLKNDSIKQRGHPESRDLETDNHRLKGMTL